MAMQSNLFLRYTFFMFYFLFLSTQWLKDLQIFCRLNLLKLHMI